jgi:cell division protein YceG involved in septum cleavage
MFKKSLLITLTIFLNLSSAYASKGDQWFNSNDGVLRYNDVNSLISEKTSFKKLKSEKKKPEFVKNESAFEFAKNIAQDKDVNDYLTGTFAILGVNHIYQF